MSELKPLPGKPTNADILEAVAQSHECLHELREETKQRDIVISKQFEQIRDIIKEQKEHFTGLLGDHTKQDDRNFKKISERLDEGQEIFDNIHSEVETIASNQVLMNKEFGILKDGGEVKTKKPVALMSQFDFGWKMIAGFSVVMAFWKFADFAFPKLIQFFIDMDKWVQR